MITIRELGDGKRRYDVRLRTAKGRVVTRTFRLRKDAERWQREQLDARDRGDWIDHRLGDQTVRDWWAEWWPTRTDLRPSTQARDESYYRNHVLARFGDDPLSSIAYTTVVSWVAELRHGGLAPATVHRCHQLLSKLLAAAVKARRIVRNPCADTDNLPSIERHEMAIINPDQIRVLSAAMFDITTERLANNVPGTRADSAEIEAVAERFAGFVLLGAFSGLRFGELAGLRARRIDVTRRELRVEASMIEVRGQLIEGRPKTAAGIRTVPLPQRVLDELRPILAALDGSAFVFTGLSGEPIRAGSFRSRFWNPAVKRADLDGLRMHDLRHTAVSLWIAHGATPKQVQVWAGHRSVSTVFDRYGHLFPGNEEPVMASLDDAVFAAPRLHLVKDPAEPARYSRDERPDTDGVGTTGEVAIPGAARASDSGRWQTRTADLCRVKDPRTTRRRGRMSPKPNDFKGFGSAPCCRVSADFVLFWKLPRVFRGAFSGLSEKPRSERGRTARRRMSPLLTRQRFRLPHRRHVVR